MDPGGLTASGPRSFRGSDLPRFKRTLLPSELQGREAGTGCEVRTRDAGA